mmetsp:Transcript_9241/g.13102  ORF Transcript_9241/g.13102 Transcript_9241/m.13102 type:complete len:373 (+) Transcript_9241:98-1216(+)
MDHCQELLEPIRPETRVLSKMSRRRNTMVDDNVESTFLRLLNQETDFTSNLNLSHAQDTVLVGHAQNSVWRQRVVNWIYKVVDQTSCKREIAFITMNIVDRFLISEGRNLSLEEQSIYSRDRSSYQTVVMASLMIAMKLLEGKPSLHVQDLICMSRYSCHLKDFVKVGQSIVRNLSWNSQIPTPARMIYSMVQFLPKSIPTETRDSIFQNAIFQAELSVHDLFFSDQKSSVISLACLMNAMREESLSCGKVSSSISTEFSNRVSQLIGIDSLPLTVCTRLMQLYSQTCNDSCSQNIPFIIAPVIIPADSKDEQQIPVLLQTTYQSSSKDAKNEDVLTSRDQREPTLILPLVEEESTNGLAISHPRVKRRKIK